MTRVGSPNFTLSLKTTQRRGGVGMWGVLWQKAVNPAACHHRSSRITTTSPKDKHHKSSIRKYLRFSPEINTQIISLKKSEHSTSPFDVIKISAKKILKTKGWHKWNAVQLRRLVCVLCWWVCWSTGHHCYQDSATLPLVALRTQTRHTSADHWDLWQNIQVGWVTSSRNQITTNDWP